MKSRIQKLNATTEYYFNEGCYITELSNTENDPSLSIARARVEPKKTTKWHSLKGITERYVILEGTGKVEVGDLDPQVVNIGDTVIIPPEVRQRITNIGENSLVFLALCTPRFKETAYTSYKLFTII